MITSVLLERMRASVHQRLIGPDGTETEVTGDTGIRQLTANFARRATICRQMT
jgi:hypothetical protein